MFMADISGGLSWTQAIAKHTDIGCILKCLDEGYIPDVYGVVTNDGGKWYVLVTEISQRWAPAE